MRVAALLLVGFAATAHASYMCQKVVCGEDGDSCVGTTKERVSCINFDEEKRECNPDWHDDGQDYCDSYSWDRRYDCECVDERDYDGPTTEAPPEWDDAIDSIKDLGEDCDPGADEYCGECFEFFGNLFGSHNPCDGECVSKNSENDGSRWCVRSWRNLYGDECEEDFHCASQVCTDGRCDVAAGSMHADKPDCTSDAHCKPSEYCDRSGSYADWECVERDMTEDERGCADCNGIAGWFGEYNDDYTKCECIKRATVKSGETADYEKECVWGVWDNDKDKTCIAPDLAWKGRDCTSDSDCYEFPSRRWEEPDRDFGLECNCPDNNLPYVHGRCTLDGPQFTFTEQQIIDNAEEQRALAMECNQVDHWLNAKGPFSGWGDFGRFAYKPKACAELALDGKHASKGRAACTRHRSNGFYAFGDDALRSCNEGDEGLPTELEDWFEANIRDVCGNGAPTRPTSAALATVASPLTIVAAIVVALFAQN